MNSDRARSVFWTPFPSRGMGSESWPHHPHPNPPPSRGRAFAKRHAVRTKRVHEAVPLREPSPSMLGGVKATTRQGRADGALVAHQTPEKRYGAAQIGVKGKDCSNGDAGPADGGVDK